MTHLRPLLLGLAGAGVVLAACGPNHARIARGGAAAAPTPTASPTAEPTATPTADISPTPAPATPAPTTAPTTAPHRPTAPPAPPAFSIYQLNPPPAPGRPPGAAALTAGPDGNLWWVDPNSDVVARTTPAGVTTMFHAPGGAQPRPTLAVTPDGTLWGSDSNGKLLHITTAGAITEVDVPNAGFSPPDHLAVAGDGALWYVGGPNLYRRDADGTVTTHPLNGAYAASLLWAPDGALWFAESVSGGQGIGRLDPATGNVTHIAVPGPPDFLGPPAVGADGNLWFGESARGRVARLTLHGALTEFTLPQHLQVDGIVAGRDGNLWAVPANGSATTPVLVRVTIGGGISVIPVTGAGGGEPLATSVAAGPDGHTWAVLSHGYQAPTGSAPLLVRDNLS